MKDTANSCMIVAILIATMVFVIDFTMPGGNNGDNGIPILLKLNGFTAFAIASDMSKAINPFYFSNIGIPLSPLLPPGTVKPTTNTIVPIKIATIIQEFDVSFIHFSSSFSNSLFSFVNNSPIVVSQLVGYHSMSEIRGDILDITTPLIGGACAACLSIDTQLRRSITNATGVGSDPG
ncbi:hypothetical protein H5410_057353 [Solanum commersonii]|uniref:PGG domain-containing protein n=1 Tax=Solanum commersonii TaxID=4109 RepID=A0A9J5WMP3_SOLCO|nr:hypothetical protein H5410_057353 [Solanum commersonii]